MEDKEIKKEMKETVNKLNSLIKEAVLGNRLKFDIDIYIRYNEIGNKPEISVIEFEIYKEV